MFQHNYVFKYFTPKDYAWLRRNLPDVPLYTLEYVIRKLDSGYSLISCIYNPALLSKYSRHPFKHHLISIYNHIVSWLINYNSLTEVHSVCIDLPIGLQLYHTRVVGYYAAYLNTRLNYQVM
jgi:hypothetical protein